MAEGVRWTVSQTSHSDTVTTSSHADTLQITVTARKTEIVSRTEILFIDYGKMNLSRLDRFSRQCAVFDITATESNNIARETIALLSEIEVTKRDESQQRKGLCCDKKTVLSGAGMFRFKSMVPKVLVRYGQSFSEAVAEYWVSREIENWKVLQMFVRQREAVFAAQPLLKRIDPLGLVDAIDGFPVQGWQKTGGTLLESRLAGSPEAGNFVLQLPHECQAMPVKKKDMK